MTIRNTLEVQNNHLLRDVGRVIEELALADVPEELRPYVTRISSVCAGLRSYITQNLTDLALGEAAIEEDILSNTQQATQYLRLVSSRMLNPILRSSPSDRLSLRFIGWLHAAHPKTATYPPAVADGGCSIWPFTELCPIYFFPAAEQRVILYLPLYFHEFGHLLYRCHQQELDDLVVDLQREIEGILTPPSIRSDKHAAHQRSQRDTVVTTWYQWSQELFCDAVGLHIGGPSFLWALSTYLGTLNRGDFYRPLEELRYSTHPVTWLRIKLLLAQAKDLGFAGEAASIDQEWGEIARTIGITEDYHGFYDDELKEPILATLNDALTEVSPRGYLLGELAADHSTSTAGCTPVALVHAAWAAFFHDEHHYSEWEHRAINLWLD